MVYIPIYEGFSELERGAVEYEAHGATMGMFFWKSNESVMRVLKMLP